MKQHISMFIAGMPFTGDDPLYQSLGGSETAGLYMARELAKTQDVMVFCNTPERSEVDGVKYIPIGEFQSFATMCPHDVTIVQRLPAAFHARMASKLNILWCHDLALGRQAQDFRGSTWNLDKIALVSKFHVDQYKEVYSLPDELLWQTRNGIDPTAFERVGEVPDRDPYKLIYTSRPERGLDMLLKHIFPRLLEKEPKLKLFLAGYDNQVDHLAEFYQEITNLCRQFGDRINWLGPLTKHDLYRHYKTASVLVYPTPSQVQQNFCEVSCITAMEAMGCGLPFVSSERGALPETLESGAGVLIPGNPWDETYIDSFVENTLGLIRNEHAWNQMSEIGKKAVDKLSWSSLAEEWAENFERWIYERNDNPARLTQHFIKHSDIEAAQKVLEEHPNESLSGYIEDHYGFFKSHESVCEHYKNVVGKFYDDNLEERVNNGADLSNLAENSLEQRFHFFQTFLDKHPEVKTVYDYGCGHGWCDVYLHNKTGREFIGVDVDPNAIKWAEWFRDKYAKEPEKVKLIAGDHTADVGEVDMLLCSEVLEHVFDPYETLENIESKVRDDGWVVITVPYGPGELKEFNELPFRNHVREFDHHDIRDIFKDKKNVSVFTLAHKNCDITTEPTGWTVVIYQKSDAPLHRIDWERKLKYQRPQQTVSANLIVGGDSAKENLHWCLRSIKNHVDEIVIADTGMDEETKRILSQYPVRIIDSTSPLVDGFEKPRNDAIKESSCDWILWIDTDEKVIEPQNIHKYLRENTFNGYGIRQHHFAVDTNFAPDMPVRLFRNRPHDGDMPRFYGKIHEHPESKMNFGIQPVIILQDVHIAHVGYLIESTRRVRFGRNYPLLQADIQEYPDRRLQKYFIIRDNLLLCMYEAQQNGGRVTENMKNLAKQARDLYREHFLGQSQLLNIDPIDYYTQALQILGEGIDVAYDIHAAKDGQGDDMNGKKVVRFASLDEAKVEINHRLQEKIQPYEAKWW